jgi:hypothetical protein
MNIFYNSKKKMPQIWVFVVFIIIPIILLTIFWVVTKEIADKASREDNKKASEDVFSKF